MAVNTKAWNAVVKARTALIIDHPFFGCLAMHLQMVEEPSVGTMGTDGVHLYHAPDFVLSLTEPELVGVVAHEVWHCACKHMTRRGHRTPGRWNVACDYVVNADLKKVSPAIVLPNPHYYDPQYEGMGSEEVYERLPPDKQLIIMIGGGKGGKGNGQKGKDQGQGGQGDQLGQDPGGCGGIMDAGSGPRKADSTGNPINAQSVARDWETHVRVAIGAEAARNAGTLPGHLQRLVKQLDKPKVDWKELLRNFIDGTMSKEFSWARPNRRSAALGVLLPGMIPDALHHLVFLNDVSGSVSDKLSRSMTSECGGALDDGVCDKLTIAYFDTSIRHVDEYVRGEMVEYKVVAGGGTDYREPLQWVRENCPDASAIVMLTDMMPISWDLEDPDVPYFWGAFCPDAYLTQVRQQVKFGEVVHVDSSW